MTSSVAKKMLPKTYKHRKELSSEILAVMSHHKYLVPVMDKFVFNDGTVKNLLSLVGTVAVSYNGKLYNIPLCLWLDENYPHTAPICYVKPTREMMIIPSGHVNCNGQILLPYLDEWKHTQCDLHSLIQVMMAVFSEMPPLCMRTGAEEHSLRTSHACSIVNNSYLTLLREDGLHFQGNNETNC